MKKQLLLLSVLLAAIPLFGQADLQWLVLKGMGKNSTTNSNTTNNYSNPFGANTFFNLDGILHPDLTNFEYNKNDIFIIYQDGTFYNSRKKNSVVPDKGFFYDPDMDNVNHSFESDKPIQYLYLSNIYERDDPPQGVRAKAGSGQAHDETYIYKVPPTSASLPVPLSASHDIVRNKDITLILDKAQIQAAAQDSHLHVGPQFDFDLSFNLIFANGQENSLLVNPFFLPYPIFQGIGGSDVAIYPDGAGIYYPGTNTIRINQNCPPFVYVNLRPSSLLTPYYPGIDGNTSHKAKFTLTTGGQLIYAMNEAIQSSHDPNFVRIDSICKSTAGDQVVFSHLEFENDSPNAPNSIKVEFALPPVAEPHCFQILDWNLGGQTVSGDFTYNSGSRKAECIFNMAGAPSIQKCNSPRDEPQCTGYINFTYQIKDFEPVEDPKTYIFVRKPKVYFDGERYPVEKFIDLIDTKFVEVNYKSYRPYSTRNGCRSDCNH